MLAHIWIRTFTALYNAEKFCQTPLQLADPTQLQFVVGGVDFVFLWKEEEEE